MPYNSVISRTEVAALIPEDVAGEVLTNVVAESAALTMFRRIPVAQSQTRIPIIAALPTAYWVTGDTGLKQTTEVNWSNKYLNIEEVAAIVPIPESVLNDAAFDVWGSIRPLMEEAFGRVIDAAIFFGANAPASFPMNIQQAAVNAGNNVTEGSVAASGGFQNDIDLVYAAVEADGFDVSGIVAARSAKARLRQARSTAGERMGDVSPDLMGYLGDPIAYPMRGLFPAGGAAGTSVRLFAGDWNQFILGVRQDITYKILDQAVIQDGAGVIQYNLAQQDMVAMRCVMRLGWQVANVLNYDQAVDASRYPVGVLKF